LRVATIGYRGTNGTGDALADWISPASQQGVTDLGNAVLTPELFAPYQVIVVQDVRVGGTGTTLGRHFSTGERDALVQWVNNGGGLLTLTGYDLSAPETENVNMILAPLGLSYAAEVVFPSGASVSTWDTHPLTTGLGSVSFAGGHLVGGSTRFASIQGMYDVGRVSGKGMGRVVAWGDEAITYTEHYSTADGTRFWLNVLAWLTPPSTCRVVLPP
jgi:hypothetical protein